MSEIRSLNGYPLADTTARESISQLGSDINGIKNNYVSSGQLTQAVEDALQVAKDSGAFDGPAGADGAKGDPGKDGTSVKISSIVESQEPGGANEVTFSDGNRLSVKNGSNGTAGANGVGIQSVVQTTTSTTDGGNNVITVTKTDGKKSTFTVKNGSKGSAGADGASGKDGYTPVKGIDYFDGKDGVSPTVNVTTVSGGHMVSITDKSGTKTFTVMNGEAGASVTVSSVKPSVEDGGSNVVTFSDGTTVTIKNGTKGSPGEPGYTPVKGKDYWTADDQGSIVEQVEADTEDFIVTELAKRGQLKPEFANDISECTDQSKLYVLPDGYIYAYMRSDGYTNTVPTAIDTDGSVYNGSGYKDGYRLNHSDAGATIVEQAGLTVTGYIPVTCNDVVRMSGVTWGTTNKNAIAYFDENLTPLGSYIGNGYAMSARPEHTGLSVPSFCLQDKSLQSVITENGVATFNMVFMDRDYDDNGVNTTVARAGSRVKYMRISAEGNGSNMVVTVNEEIAGSQEGGGYGWVSTGHAFVPADYEERIVELEEQSAEMQQTIRDILDGTTEIAANAKFDPTVYDLPILYLTGDVSPIRVSKDNKVTLDYVYGARSGTCTLKGQGASSYKAAQALGDKGKFNYTINFDSAFEASTGWGAQTKYCLKANFIDHTHARNVLSAKTWGMIVKARANASAHLSGLVNGGAVDGFPIIIMVNNEFHGLYTWNIPKDGWMMNMTEDATKTQAIVGANQHSTATKFKGELAGDESDFELEFVSDESNSAWVATSLNRLINACVNSNGTDLDTTVAQYLDWDSAIDYYIVTVILMGSDMVDKNFLLSTFDGTKWHFTAYDMDSTYGLRWDGSGLDRADQAYSFSQCAATSRVFELIKTYKASALKTRYAQLRSGVLSEAALCERFENFAWAIPSPVLVEDVKRYPSVKGSSVNGIDQICRWLHHRLAVCDEWMDGIA